MSNRIFDSSQLTKRRGERAIAGSFLTRMGPPNNLQGSAPYLGIKDVSIMNAVKSGGMTQYTRYPTCVGISTGCPCPETNSFLSLPGSVTGITFTIGSIIVSWNPPTSGSGPFSYLVTPYLNGIAQTQVSTTETSYRFTDLQEWQPYSFRVCAMNSSGSGPIVPTPYIIAPPASLSSIMSGSSDVVSPEPSLKYVMNIALNSILKYVASVNLGPTRGSRFIYVWIMSVISAWNWVKPESMITGIHDNWDWDAKLASSLSDNDSILWMCAVIDYITPFFIPSGYTPLFTCPVSVTNRVKTAGEWDTWVHLWRTWFNGRDADGYKAATTTQPAGSANWNTTIIVDGKTVNNISGFPQPQQWTRLTVQGKKQGYLTHTWDSVQSTCLTETNEAAIQVSVAPLSGQARDAEVDAVIEITANLTDEQKIIAEFWAGGPGTVSPPLMFIWFWKVYILSKNDISCPKMMYSLLDLAIHLFEGGRVTWRLKSAFMEARPIQEIRRRYAGQQISSWNGMVDGAQWVPYQEANFVTPPFADFPSGHSHFSKAFALTMSKWFGDNIEKKTVFYDGLELICPVFKTDASETFGDFTIPVGNSNIQANVPSVPITLSFSTWNDISDSAGISRLYGGIHCSSANTVSSDVAELVDGYINSAWNIQTSNIIEVDSEDNSNIAAGSTSQTSSLSSLPSNKLATNILSSTKPYSIKINYMTRVPAVQIQNLIMESKQFIESIITQSHGLRSPSISLEHDMVIDIDIQSLASNILAGARPTIVNTSVIPAMPLRQTVILNSNRLNELVLTTVQFNNKNVARLVPVLIHEILHGLGVAALVFNGITVGWDRFIDSSKTWYTGLRGDWAKSEAIKAYREIVGSTDIKRIPIENSFGTGTAYSHWEEGLKDGFVKEGRYFNYGKGSVLHPSLPEEIMTGIAGVRFYFTKMTAGALMDRGYKVDLANPNIVAYPLAFLTK
jgi:hypothetical protein